MSSPDPRAPTFVASADALAAFVERLRAEPIVALDTESNSFHVYKERVCLLQLSTPTEDVVVDPLSVDVRPLGEVLCDGRETVLHGADYDVRCLKREWGWRLPRLFDTMAAARRLGAAGLGLSALVEQHFGVRLAKTFQRSDWGRRPLTVEQLSYAALDTHFLLPLHRLLAGALQEKGAATGAREEFDKISAVEPRERVFDPEGWRHFKAARGLEPEARAVLRALWIAREDRARAVDRPPFKVLAEETMIQIAKRRPRTMEDLSRFPGVTPQVLKRMGDTVLAAIRSADPGPA